MSLSAISVSARNKVEDYYELTVQVSLVAQKGWELFQQGKFMNEFNGGKYTEPDYSTRCLDFWSNGKIAKFDREGNGHHETIFVIRKKQLVYVGSIGPKGTFVDVSKEFTYLLNKYVPKDLK